jgi:hypothetical protein
MAAGAIRLTMDGRFDRVLTDYWWRALLIPTTCRPDGKRLD